ncbi:2-oxoacid dehydrogenases acyltransferase-domain-containing protein [Zopfochytrium polystomum]|nr:2-oxoacid dehydrogenases acyltransferase-domain-containing protein [Zopfochytrium polystomum]
MLFVARNQLRHQLRLLQLNTHQLPSVVPYLTAVSTSAMAPSVATVAVCRSFSSLPYVATASSLPSATLPVLASNRISSARTHGNARVVAHNDPRHELVWLTASSDFACSGNIGTWRKKIGDAISQGDVLVEIETDKAQMDFECQEEGFLARVFLDAGAKDVPVGTPLCILVENKEDVEAFGDFTLGSAPVPTSEASGPTETPQAASSPTTVTPPAAVPAVSQSSGHSGERILASPAARFIAASKGVPLDQVTGTGPNGRILKGDVEAFKGAGPVPTPAPAVPAVSVVAAFTPAPQTAQLFEDIPVSNVRKVIASRLTESKQSIPHYYLTTEINVDAVLKLRETLNAKAGGLFKISVNDFVIKASSLALRDVPEVNSAWQGSFIRQYKTADICVAVATETGLITPILTQVEAKGLSIISGSMKELASRARDGKLAPHEYQGGSFTISNLGMFGIQSFTAIINPPHAAILAVGGVEDKLVLDSSTEKGFASQKSLRVTLSCDHRVVDGAVGAKWLQKFKGYVENPISMLL